MRGNWRALIGFGHNRISVTVPDSVTLLLRSEPKLNRALRQSPYNSPSSSSFVVVVVARDILDGMLRKILARGPRASATRSFHSSAPARRIVATNPVKAQEVQSFGKYPIIEHEYDAIVV